MALNDGALRNDGTMRAIAGRVLLQPPVTAHPSPPTLTWLAAGDADAISGGLRILPRRKTGANTALYDTAGDPHYEVVGAPNGKIYVDSTDLARADFLTGGSGQSRRWPASWVFETDADRIDIYTRGLGSTVGYRVWVLDSLSSGRFLPTQVAVITSAATAGTRYRLKVQFATAEPRVVIYQPQDPYFGGVVIPPTATLQRPKWRRPRFGVLSDSTGAGASGVGVIEAWPLWAAEYLGMDCWNLSIGGSGWIAAPSYQSRLQDVLDADLDHLVVAGGQNDKAGNTAADILTAAETFLRAVKAGSPKTRLYLGGIHMTSEALDVKNEPLETGLRALAATLGVPFVSLRDPQAQLATAAAFATGTAYLAGDVVAYNGLTWICVTGHTAASWTRANWRPTSFLTGTGKVGGTVGDGNADVIMGSDGVHYSAAGHKAQGLFYAEQLAPYLALRLVA